MSQSACGAKNCRNNTCLHDSDACLHSAAVAKACVLVMELLDESGSFAKNATGNATYDDTWVAALGLTTHTVLIGLAVWRLLYQFTGEGKRVLLSLRKFFHVLMVLHPLLHIPHHVSALFDLDACAPYSLRMFAEVDMLAAFCTLLLLWAEVLAGGNSMPLRSIVVATVVIPCAFVFAPILDCVQAEHINDFLMTDLYLAFSYCVAGLKALMAGSLLVYAVQVLCRVAPMSRLMERKRHRLMILRIIATTSVCTVCFLTQAVLLVLENLHVLPHTDVMDAVWYIVNVWLASFPPFIAMLYLMRKRDRVSSVGMSGTHMHGMSSLSTPISAVEVSASPLQSALLSRRM